MEIRISDELEKVLEEARNEALRTGWEVIIPDHLMLALLRFPDSEACRLLHVRGVRADELKAQLDKGVLRSVALPYNALETILPCEQVMSALNSCLIEAVRDGSARAGSVHLLAALCGAGDSLCSGMLAERGITRENVASRNDTPLQLGPEVAACIEARLRSLMATAWTLEN